MKDTVTLLVEVKSWQQHSVTEVIHEEHALIINITLSGQHFGLLINQINY